jgi:hypothetical protein
VDNFVDEKVEKALTVEGHLDVPFRGRPRATDVGPPPTRISRTRVRFTTPYPALSSTCPNPGGQGSMVARPAPALASSADAVEFVRFCYGRRKVGWPELYDEMCHVATRGLFRGMGRDALADVGVGFSLFETPQLAALVMRIVGEEQAARRAARAAALEAAARSGDEAPSVVGGVALAAGAA